MVVLSHVLMALSIVLIDTIDIYELIYLLMHNMMADWSFTVLLDFIKPCIWLGIVIIYFK